MSTATDKFIIELPAEQFLAVITLVTQAAERNRDHRIKGFYMGILRDFRAAYQDNTGRPAEASEFMHHATGDCRHDTP